MTERRSILLRAIAAAVVVVACTGATKQLVQPLPPDPVMTGRAIAFREHCGQCHGVDGISVSDEIPNLAGQSAAYLDKQLLDLKKGFKPKWPDFRANPVMGPHAKALSNDEARAVAAYYASLPCGESALRPIVTPSKPPIVARCEACHGEAGRSPNGQMVPHLAGQNATYLVNQMVDFQRTARKEAPKPGGRARGHPIMDFQVRNMTPDALHQIARYFSSRLCKMGN